jgi:Fe-S cluster assembly protein SufB
MDAYTPPHYSYGFSDPEEYLARTPPGLHEGIVRAISDYKQEPEWMLEKRLAALAIYQSKPVPTWGADLSGLDTEAITYFLRAQDRAAGRWEDVPESLKKTFDRLGVPEAERAFLAGTGAQYESEAIYHSLKSEWEDQGVIFLDTDTALRKHPDLVRRYFGTLVPAKDNKYAALNTAVWSGGSFVYIPEGVTVTLPVQAYFRINAQAAGQFERTLIIAEKNSSLHYVEGCSAPTYTSASLHSAVVEIFVGEGASVRYTTIQNWSQTVYNLVTKRSTVQKNGHMEWVDCNLGSGVTMKYPSIYLYSLWQWPEQDKLKTPVVKSTILPPVPAHMCFPSRYPTVVVAPPTVV